MSEQPELTFQEFVKIVEDRLQSIENRLRYMEELFTSAPCDVCTKEHDVIMDIMGVSDALLRSDMARLERKINGEPEISAEESLYRF